MTATEAIFRGAKERGLAFLLAGGHAVIVHGYQRTTFDTDLVIRRVDRQNWLEFMLGLGFELFHEGPAFLQFNPSAGQRALVDLMFTNDDTFAKLLAEALPNPLGPPHPPVVSLRHLLAMKCHAIRHGHPGRIVKDADDVMNLFLANKLNPNDAQWRELIKKHGTGELYEKLLRICGKN